MKHRVAGTLKWNTIDKVSSQVLYAVTGIILANVLTKEDFGLVGAVLVFQSFASLFVDSGFSYALLQRKRPTQIDYCTVFWFNMLMACALYALLWACAPWIAVFFKDDLRLIPLSRVMFLSFIINATAIVQTNVLMKRMDVKMVAVSNTVGLMVSSAVGITLALEGYGAWAIVWQTIVLAAVKSAVLWLHGSWRPAMHFSVKALRSFFNIGMGVMGSSALNILFQNIYSIFIGNRNGMVSLGYYTQADKWSKMGISSLSSILNTSFLPALAQYQDSPEEFAKATSKMHRLAAYLLFPAVGFLAMVATPLFHVLFGDKWDPAIILFQLLLLRGVFTVLQSLYSNYFLALGHSKLMVMCEVMRDVLALVAIVFTLPYIEWSTPDALCYGVEILLWGQIAASGFTWVATLVIAARVSWRTWWQYVADLLPYVVEVSAIMLIVWPLAIFVANPWLLLAAQGVVAMALYVLVNSLAGSRIQRDVLDYLLHRRTITVGAEG